MEPMYYEKQSSEKIKLTFDASNIIDTGDTISSITVKVYDDDDTDVTSTIISGTPSFSGTDITAWIQAGTSGEIYNLQVKITTTAGEILEDDLELHIKDIG